MNGRRFLLILVSVIILASIASHAVILFSGVLTTISDKGAHGTNFHGAPIVVGGSSLEFFGLDWDALASNYSRQVDFYTAPGASPCEMEALLRHTPSPDFTIIGIDFLDLDETDISVFRADLVSPWQSWRDLADSGADSFVRERTLRQYPLRYMRMLFPTVGRSMATVGAVKKVYLELRHHGGAEEPRPTFNTGGNWPTNRVSEWAPDKALRAVVELRADCGGKHSFAGPKHVALIRLLEEAAARGPVIVVVMPESPKFNSEFVNDADVKKFEDSLEDVARRVPSAKWIRFDRMPKLRSNELYMDFIHLNAYGRALATAALLKEMKPIVGGS